MLIVDQKLEYVAKEIADVDAEIARFHGAVERFTANTLEQADAVRKSTGDKEAEILEGHIAIISDPFMKGEIENLIKAHQCAEASVEQICQMFIDMFTATGDDLTMQRAADVRISSTACSRSCSVFRRSRSATLPRARFWSSRS